MTELVSLDYSAAGSDRRFVESLRTTGFGVLNNHPLDLQLVSDIYQHWLAFFDSGRATEYTVNRESQDGFFSREDAESAKGFEHKDIKEYFHFYPWGQCPSELRQELMQYYRSAHDLAATLLGWIEQYSPPDVAAGYLEPLSAMIVDSDITLLRILHYPPLPSPPGQARQAATRAAAHEDINLLTILPISNVPGLQVRGKDDSWIEVPCGIDDIVVNIGDMLQEASGGYFPSTTHRVVNPVNDADNVSRMSLPLFLHPRPDVKLSTRHTAGSYLDERLRELGVV
jgi:isopenicillin N synthase-like dioxygenase